MKKECFIRFRKIMALLMAMILAVLTLGGCSGDKGGANETPTVTEAAKKTEDPTVAPTDAPAAPTDAPATPTDAPATPTDVPAEPVDDPIDDSVEGSEYDLYFEPEGGRVFNREALFHTGTYLTEDLYDKEFCGICLVNAENRFHFFEYAEGDVGSINADGLDSAYLTLASTPENSIFVRDLLVGSDTLIGTIDSWYANEDGDLEFEINGEKYLGTIYQEDEGYNSYMFVSFGDYGIWYVMIDHDYSYDDGDNTDSDNTEFDPSNLSFVEDMPKSFMEGQQFYGLCKTDSNGGQYFFEYVGWPGPGTVDEFGDYAYIDLNVGDETIAAVCGFDHIYSTITRWYIDEDGLLVMETETDTYYAQIYEEPDDTTAVYLALIMGDECYWYKLVIAAG
jgi:hypothetical protein